MFGFRHIKKSVYVDISSNLRGNLCLSHIFMPCLTFYSILKGNENGRSTKKSLFFFTTHTWMRESIALFVATIFRHLTHSLPTRKPAGYGMEAKWKLSTDEKKKTEIFFSPISIMPFLTLLKRRWRKRRASVENATMMMMMMERRKQIKYTCEWLRYI